ncbi:MAG: TonB-dependent receptor [Bacteroidales bacterium]|nr:TonB-dependent receptor [Bacteroidales bacterium]
MKVSRYYITVLILVLITFKGFSQHYAISGYVTDSLSRETLIGAGIQWEGTTLGVVSDNNGFFQFAGFSPGQHPLIISYIGYEPKRIIVDVKNKSLVIPEIKLVPRILEVDEVSIIAAKPDVVGDREVETSMIELTSKSIQSIPAAGNDVFSAIKYLPGIDRTEPFSPLFTVRGGDPGENAVLLDGVMIYNPYHSSITSGIFNTQTIKSVDLLIGGFGSEYGGRNSSVMYISTKDGNSSKLHGEIEPSTIHSKAFLEFPVGDKGSAMVAGRYFYDIFSEFIMNNKSYFYDFNISYTYRLNRRNRFTFKYFHSLDRTGVNFNTFYRYFGNTFNTDIYDDFDLRLLNRWQNRAATVIHKWILSPRLFVRTQLYYSVHESDNFSGTDFSFTVVEEGMDTLRFQLKTSSNFTNKISDLSGKTVINYKIAAFSTLRLGAEVNNYYFKNRAWINEIDQGSLKNNPLQWAGFIEDKINAGPVIIRPGIRLTHYDYRGLKYEPRLNIVISLPWDIRLKAAYGHYYQHVISMNTNEVEMNQSVDYYFPLKNYEPSKSIHYVAGIEKRLTPMSLISMDVYYKDMEKVYTFDINQTDNEVITLSDKLQQGSGKAYGAELLLRGSFKNFSGWISYGLSWATRQYPFLNNGEPYPYDYNRRHALKVVANYAITKTLEYNVSFVFLSGVYRSIEQVMQNYYYYDPVTNELSFFPVWLSNGKNNAKMPAHINLDMSIKKRLRSGFGKQLSDVFNATESYVTITIRNLTFFRRNVEYYFPIATEGRWEGKYLPLGTNYFPSVGVSYTIKF